MIVVGVSSFLLFAVCSNDPKLKDGNTGCQYPFSLARLALLGLPGNACDRCRGRHWQAASYVYISVGLVIGVFNICDKSAICWTSHGTLHTSWVHHPKPFS